jgi:hypothetical protein
MSGLAHAHQPARAPARVETAARRARAQPSGPSSQVIQTKLRVGAVDDPLEHEADRVADAIIAGAAPPPMGDAPSAPQRKCAACAANEEKMIRRKCEGCEAEESETVRRAADRTLPASSNEVATSAPPAVQGVLQARGEPLEPATRAYFEPRFGRDFGDVRIHADSAAADSAWSIGAKAYASGDHVAFAHGEYRPGTVEGDRLLAHELAHVVQQGARGAASSVQLKPARVTSITVNLATDTVTLALDTGRTANGTLNSSNLVPGEYRAAWKPSEQALIINPWPTREEIIDFDVGGTSLFLSQFERMRNAMTREVPFNVINEPAPAPATDGGPTGSGSGSGAGGEGSSGPAVAGGAGSAGDGSMLALSSEEMQRRCEANDLPGIKVFPFRGTRFGAAPVMAHRDGDDIVVKLPVYVRSNDDFRRQTQTLPISTFIHGVRLRPNEVVRVHVYEPRWYHLNITGSTDGDIEREFCVTGEQMLEIAAAARQATWMNIGLTAVEGATLFIPVGELVAQPVMSAGRTGLASAMIGTAEAAPVALRVAESAAVTVVERQVETQVVGQAIRQTVAQTVVRSVEETAVGAAPRAAVSRLPGAGAGALGHATATGTVIAAEEAAGRATGSALAPAQPSATGIGSESTTQSLAPVAGAEEVTVSAAEYRAALELSFPSQFANELAGLADGVGQRAAQRAVADPRFVAAVNGRNWRQAGTLFHSAAAQEIRALPASAIPSGWTVQAERTIQSGLGGSRADFLARGPAGEIVEFDWKTTGRSALSTGSRREMQRHAGQISVHIPGTQTVQESRSWIDYVRALMPGVRWPR